MVKIRSISILFSDSNWMCCRCLHNEPKKLRMSDIQSRRNSLRSISSVESDSQVNSGIKRVKTLPYDVSILNFSVIQ